jgi:NAD(P)-dependent dehydrogenase (short-subunit alcohol dehydrogenase family)
MRNISGKNKAYADSLDKESKEENLDIRIIELDVTNEASVINAIDKISNEVGSIDILINNAGIWGPGVLEAYGMEQWQQIFDINVFGSVRVLNAVLPFMRKQQNGLVIQISSLQGRFILPYSGPYVSTKWAIEGAMETYRYELAPLGVEVCIVEPYDFLTEMKGKAVNYVASSKDIQQLYGSADYVINNFYLVPDPTRASDPSEVVDAIASLIHQQPGERPTRTTVKNPLQQIEQINQLQNEMHQQLFPYIGLQDLLQLKK